MRAPALPLVVALVASVLPASAGAVAGAELRVRPRAGVAYHRQLSAAGLAAGASAGVALGDHFAVGLGVEHLRFRYGRTGVSFGQAQADLEATLQTTPVLLEAEARAPLAGPLVGFLGAGAGPVFTAVEIRATGGTARPPVTRGESIAAGGTAFAGLGIGLGPGRFTLEGRYLVVSGEVDGAAKGVSAGGLSGQAGYELSF